MIQLIFKEKMNPLVYLNGDLISRPERTKTFFFFVFTSKTMQFTGFVSVFFFHFCRLLAVLCTFTHCVSMLSLWLNVHTHTHKHHIWCLKTLGPVTIVTCIQRLLRYVVSPYNELMSVSLWTFGQFVKSAQRELAHLLSVMEVSRRGNQQPLTADEQTFFYF